MFLFFVFLFLVVYVLGLQYGDILVKYPNGYLCCVFDYIGSLVDHFTKLDHQTCEWWPNGCWFFSLGINILNSETY